MSKMSKAIAVLGVVAGLGVAAMPLSSYAATSVTSSPATTVQAEVKRSLAIAVKNTTGSTDYDEANHLLDLGELMVNGPAVSKSLDVVVYSNSVAQNYSLSIAPATAGQTDMVGTTDSTNTIPAKAAFGDGQGAGWGFKVGEATSYTKLDAAGNELESSATTSTALDATTNIDGVEVSHKNATTVTFAAAADTNTKQDTYKVDVVFTATELD